MRYQIDYEIFPMKSIHSYSIKANSKQDAENEFNTWINRYKPAQIKVLSIKLI